MFLRCVEGSVNSAADPEDRARGEVAKGVWDAVDTTRFTGVKMSSKPSKRWLFDTAGGRREQN